MFLSARSPGSCRHLREHGLHLMVIRVNGARCYYVLRRLLLCAMAAVEATPHLCVFERNRPRPVRRRLNRTHVGLGKLNPGGVELTSYKCMESVQFSSVQFSSVQFSSVQFSSVQFSSVFFYFCSAT